MEKIFVIYKVTNKINGKLYIGKTYNLKKRKNEHIGSINDGLPFHRALKKYGIENFSWEVIDTSNSEKEILKKEIFWIKELKTCIHDKNSNGYNVTIGGEGGVSWNSKPVRQYGMDGNFIEEYLSCSHSSVITGLPRHGISDCANNISHYCGNYIWKYKEECDEDNIFVSLREHSSNLKVKIIQLDLDGYIINFYNSVIEASKLTNTSRTSISGCLSGRNSTANNFQWIYFEDYDLNKDYKYKGHKIGKGIYQLDDDFNIINHFNNCSEAARYLNEPTKVHKQIHKALHSNKRCRGFYWRKVEDYNKHMGIPC